LTFGREEVFESLACLGDLCGERHDEHSCIARKRLVEFRRSPNEPRFVCSRAHYDLQTIVVEPIDLLTYFGSQVRELA
jgi:hypothetical protein